MTENHTRNAVGPGASFEARQADMAQQQGRLVVNARHMVQVLEGKRTDEKVVPDKYPDSGAENYPAAIPTVAYAVTFRGIERELLVISSLGSYYAREVNDTPQSVAFDTGFYAGVLAARLGLVEVEQFTETDEQ